LTPCSMYSSDRWSSRWIVTRVNKIVFVSSKYVRRCTLTKIQWKYQKVSQLAIVIFGKCNTLGPRVSLTVSTNNNDVLHSPVLVVSTYWASILVHISGQDPGLVIRCMYGWFCTNIESDKGGIVIRTVPIIRP